MGNLHGVHHPEGTKNQQYWGIIRCGGTGVHGCVSRSEAWLIPVGRKGAAVKRKDLSRTGDQRGAPVRREDPVHPSPSQFASFAVAVGETQMGLGRRPVRQHSPLGRLRVSQTDQDCAVLRNPSSPNHASTQRSSIFPYPLMAPINNTQEMINAGPSNPTKSPPSLRSFCSINPVL